MKTHCLLLLAIGAINFMVFAASAQETNSDNKLKIGFGIGLNFSGPQQQMGELMKKYDYDDTQKNWFKIFNNKDYITYPIYSDAGFTAHISGLYPIAPKSQVGIMLNYSAFGEVIGYSNTYGRLDIWLSNLSVIPLYTYELKDCIEIQAGPALMINSGNNVSTGEHTANEKYTRYSLGLFTGLNLKIWNRKVTFGKIGADYLLTTESEMGPYTSETFNSSNMVPESKLNFSHGNFTFVFGLKL